MSVLNDLLEYQKVDADLRKIEQEIAASPERKKFIQAKKFMETAAEKLEAQDRRAVELRRAVQNLTARYKKVNEEISDYAALEEMVDGGGDVGYYKRSAQQLSDSLRALKAELNKLISDIESACEEYKKMKEQTIAMQKQYKEYSEKFKEVKNARSAEVDEINKKLKAIGEKIPEETLEKYKVKRKERIFPILVPLTGGMCICGMDLSLVQQGKLSGGNVIECEHCHRFIYNK